MIYSACVPDVTSAKILDENRKETRKTKKTILSSLISFSNTMDDDDDHNDSDCDHDNARV